MVVDVLPRWERYTYWIVGLSGMAYSVYALFLEGDSELQSSLSFQRTAKFIAQTIVTGWTWLGRYQDQSDREFELWKSRHTVKILATIAHVMTSQICFYCKVRPQLHAYTLITVDLTSAYILLGGGPLAVLVFSAILIFVVSLAGKTWLVWSVAIAMMYYWDSMKVPWLTRYSSYYHFVVIAGFFNIRIVSFGLEKAKYRASQAARASQSARASVGPLEQSLSSAGSSGGQNNPTDQENMAMIKNHEPTSLTQVPETGPLDSDPSLCDLLLYCFYWPTFHFGPILIYRGFHREIKQAMFSQHFSPDTCDILKQILRIAFWFVFLEFQAHFLYHNAIASNPALFEQTTYSAVAGVGFWHGQYFMMKYVVFYGLASQICRFDGLSPVARPRCLSWVYSFADIWKCFDVGLYNFTKTHIYIPLGGSRAGILRQLFASGVGFTFIIFWHSLSLNTAILFMVNYLINCLQVLAGEAEKGTLLKTLKSRVGPAMYLRIQVILAMHCYIIGGLIMSHFFFRETTGWKMTEQLFIRAPWTKVVMLCVVITACIHNGMCAGQWYRERIQKLARSESRPQKQKSS
ncbi:unnamed protein product [Candidula unifasciata]|uniref:Uncharacterized protein n=1 Tax=Candidula unifasciata TaxID=100452 RepID=A0A8S3ZBR2_9EUPU|nr:unnamed protein product [Candidula unifasciata]